MESLYTCCAGLDVHKQTVVACLLRPAGDGERKEIQTFRTSTAALEALRDWLLAAGCTHAAMEATGSFWKPVYNVLDGHCTIVVANAAHMHALPGRKTDVRDAEWIATLLKHGLLRASFIPSREQRELRDLTRTRTSLTDERSAAVNRVQQVLEDANIKVAGVATDIMGKSGRDILAALLEGVMSPAEMADLARGKLRHKHEALEQALRGHMSAHHRLLIALHLEHIDLLDAQIARLSAEIAERLRPHETALLRLETIPGVGRRTAEILAAEMGVDMGRFPTAGHLASWAGMCPGQRESGGRKHSAATRKGSKWLRGTLTECAKGIVRTKATYLSARYHRIKSRRGHAKATIATGHKILTAAYHVLNRGVPYHELGEEFFYRRDTEATERYRRRLIHQLERLGHKVTLEALPEAA
jgi:transposase